MKEAAEAFLDACETGKGWDACAPFCHDGATFACQSAALAEVTALKDYCEWMKGAIAGPLPNARYEIKSFGVDETRSNVIVYAVFHASHTGDGGPAPPTGKTTASDYVYCMQFDGAKIRAMTKIWNDGYAMAQLGWG